MRMFAKGNPVLWRCDFCDGPANWTFIDEEPYYSCKQRCAGFRQRSLWEDVSDIRYTDSDMREQSASAAAVLRKLVDGAPKGPPFVLDHS